MKRSFLILFLSTIGFTVLAQLREEIPRFYPERGQDGRASSLRLEETTLTLPFFDNFTYNSSVGFTSHWIDSTGPKIETITKAGQNSNVLVFDGLNSKGGSYSDSLTVRVRTDSLISYPIDLASTSSSDSVRLSISWQIASQGMPDSSSGDRFTLFAKDQSQAWVPIWVAPYNAQPSVIYNESFLLSSQFLHTGFQIGFLRTGISGDSIVWYLNKVEITKTISIPFWEDFSAPATFSQKFKTNTGVYINNQFSIDPPSPYVASFDGLDDNGGQYGGTPFASGQGDSLVSVPIDLSKFNIADSLLFSFYSERMGNGEDPDRTEGDSLVLKFRDDSGSWRSVWRSSLNDSISRAKFFQTVLVLKDSSFFHSSFRFKFVNYARLSGSFDLWHVDYINLDVAANTSLRQRLGNKIIYSDQAISKRPTSIIAPYTSIPYFHLSSITLKDTFSFSVANLGLQVFGATSYVLKLVDSTSSTTITPKTPPKDNVTFPSDTVWNTSMSLLGNDGNQVTITTPNGPFRLENKVYLDSIIESTSAYLFQQNDTVLTTFNFDNYYAYDDGTYERCLTADQANSAICLCYVSLKDDTLNAIDFSFPYDGYNLEGAFIKVHVWPENNGRPGDIPVSTLSTFFMYSKGRNPFTRYQIDPLAVKAGVPFYIGFEQQAQGSRAIRVGFDKNNDAKAHYYSYSYDDPNWTQFGNPFGAPMIRPVFGVASSAKKDNGKEVQNVAPLIPLVVYPNPNQTGDLYLSTKFDRIDVFDLFLKPLGTYYYTDKLNIENLQPGMYIISTYLQGKRQDTKFIYQPN